jgi:uncharacterized membrane protein
MKTRIIHFFEIISANFWMIPLFSLMLGAGLAFLNFYLDKTVFAEHVEYSQLFLYFNNSQNIRTLLSVSATSVLGVAGVSFSITIASLTLASQQFGPRLLRNFMLDRFNQVVLGCFIGTFLYCFLMLQFTSSMDLEKTTPFISMIGLLVLIILSLLLLVFFIHHIAVAIQADSVISDVDRELVAQMNVIFPENCEENQDQLKLKVPENLDSKFKQKGQEVHSQKSGYLQAIDLDNIIAFVTDNDCAIKFNIKPGDFIMRRSVIAYYLENSKSDKDSIENQINSKLIIGIKSSAEQDPEFAIRQLVEVAVRALSPGINDPFTAVTCIDRLGNNIAYLMDRQFPAEHHIDESGHLRVQLKPFTFNGIVEASFNQIRQHGENDIAVTIHLLRTLHKLILQARTSEQAEALKTQAEAISTEKHEKNIAKKDKDDIEDWYQAIDSALNQKKDNEKTKH